MKIFCAGNLRNKILKNVLSFAAAQALLLGSCQIALAAPKLEWGNGILAVEKAGLVRTPLWPVLNSKGQIFINWDTSDELPIDGSILFSDLTLESNMQKLGSDGKKLWANPVSIRRPLSLSYGGGDRVLTSDGGAVTVWVEGRAGRKPDIFAQKIGADGSKLWGENGIAVYDGPGAQQLRGIQSDNNGGFIIAWYDDERAGCYMQRIDGSGKAVWQKDGISLNEVLGIKSVSNSSNDWSIGGKPGDFVNIASDGKDGLYICWNELKAKNPPSSLEGMDVPKDGNIFVQRIDGNGKKVWQSNYAIPLKNSYMDSYQPNPMVVLEDGSVLVRWSYPIGKPSLEDRAGSESYYANPNNQYYYARLLPTGESTWDYSKPMFEVRGIPAIDGYNIFCSMEPMTVKGGVIFFREISGYISQYDDAADLPKENTETASSKLVDQGIEAFKVGFDGKVAWKKEMKSPNVGYSPLLSSLSFYTPNGLENTVPSVESFYIYSFSNASKYNVNNDFTLTRFNSVTGAEEWHLYGKDIPNIEKMLDTNFIDDRNGGLYMVWQEGLEPKAVAPKKGTPALDDTQNEPTVEFQQSNIYIQHIVDDGSGWADLQISNWAYPHVQNLVKKNVISGYGNGDFKPGNSITRAEFAKMIICALGVQNTSADSKQASSNTVYSDIKGHWAEKYIKSAILSGAIKGYDNGTIKPDAKITRAEAVAMVSRAKGIDAKASAQDFKDVSKDFWAFDEIEALSGLGAISGYGDGTFRPSGLMTRAEAAKIVDLVANVMQ